MALVDPAQAYITKIHEQHKASLQDVNDASSIVPAYSNTTVLITGVGFLGRHLLEKLFRCCNIKKAYLLMRPKKGKGIQERLNEILKDSVFDGIRNMQPTLETRVVPVAGDAKELRLGIADDDWNTLNEEVEYIFHAAATVNFEEHIQIATLTNVRGTREIVALAKVSKKLKALVHVSTAFCQANRDRIGLEVREEFYPAPMSPDLLINMAESLPADVLKDMTDILLQKWPNTYTFTKSVAEEVMRLASEELPVGIVRPAIVINAFREPVPGWLDPSSMYGPSGIVLGVGLGIMHTLLVNEQQRIDTVPVDYVTNATIAVGYAASNKERDKIYHVSSTRYYRPWHINCHTLLQKSTSEFMTPKAIWYSFLISTSNVYLFTLLNWILHYIPAYILDGLCWALGKPTTFKKIYQKVAKLTNALAYFTTNQWDFVDHNLLGLYERMTKHDKAYFNCNISTVDWDEQMILWALSVRKYIIRDNLEDTVFANKKQAWMRFVHYAVVVVCVYVIWKIFSFVFSFVF